MRPVHGQMEVQQQLPKTLVADGTRRSSRLCLGRASQSLSGLNTRIVVPLLPLSEAPVPAKRLNPVFEIGTEPHVMVTQFLAAIPRSLLGQPVTNLDDHHTEVMAALDMVLIDF